MIMSCVRKTTILVFVTVFILCLISPVTLVEGLGGIGVSPSAIRINDAVKGGEYERTIYVFNPGTEVTDYSLEAIGENAGWVSFFEPSRPDTPIERVTVADEGKASVMVRFNIPTDAANGDHEITINVISVPGEGQLANGKESIVSLAAEVVVTITVTGEQILSGIFLGVTTRDVEAGYPLRLQVYFENTGNVVATPQIVAEIRGSDTTEETVTFPAEAKIKPGLQEIIAVEWDTTGKVPGDYVATVTLSLDGEVIGTKDVEFAILPEGTLTRIGTLVDVAIEGSTIVGNTVKVMANFVNAGEMDITAKFIGEIYIEGEFVDAFTSEEILVAVGKSQTLASYVTLNDPGPYSIKGHVNYNGKLTDVVEVSFEAYASDEDLIQTVNVKTNGVAPEDEIQTPSEPNADNVMESSSESSDFKLVWAGVVVILILMLTGGAFVLRKRTKSRA